MTNAQELLDETEVIYTEQEQVDNNISKVCKEMKEAEE